MWKRPKTLLLVFAGLAALSTARAVSGGSIPRGVTDALPPDAPAIRAVAVFADASAETKVSGVWVAGNADPSGAVRPAPPAGARGAAGTGSSGGELLGTWSCQAFFGGMPVGAGRVSFDPSGRAQVGNRSYAYRLEGGGVRLEDESGYSDYRYAVQGESLRMWAGDGSEFRCGKAAGRPGNPTRNPLSQTGRAPAGYGPPPGARGGDDWRLRGTYCHWSGSSSSSSSYGRTERITFDGQGRWTFGTEASFSSGAGLAYGGSGGGSGTYRVSGRQIFYQTASGEQGVASVNMQQDDGRVTEIIVNGELYAPQLCE